MARESICFWKKKEANAKILGHINLRFWLPRHLLLCPYVCLCRSPLIYFFLQFLPSSTSQIFAYRMARRLLRKGNRKIRSGTGWDFLIATFLGFVFVKIAAMGQSKIKSNSYNNRTSFQLTLLGPEGGHIVPPLSRITVQIHVQACWKNLTFPNYEFGNGQYAFTP